MKSESSPPPGVWPKAHRLATRVLAPVERFLAIEAASGIVLLLGSRGRARLGQFALARELRRALAPAARR